MLVDGWYSKVHRYILSIMWDICKVDGGGWKVHRYIPSQATKPTLCQQPLSPQPTSGSTSLSGCWMNLSHTKLCGHNID